MRPLLLTLLLVVYPVAAVATARVDEQTAVARSQSALGRSLPPLQFVDANGNPLRLADLRGTPLVLTLVYTACSDICPLVIQNLRPLVENARILFGEERFAVLTVGFDARRDTPERMRAFARSQGISFSNWHFLSGDEATIEALAEAVGFTFYPYAGGFGHLALISIIDTEGRVYRQIYGDSFEPPQLFEPLKDVVYGRYRPVTDFAGLADRVRLFCTVYDPNSGRYVFDYSLFLAIGIGLACLSVVAALLIREVRRLLRARPRHLIG